MEDGDVNEFVHYRIAILRPNKKTYSILQWIPQGRYWRAIAVTPEAIAAATLCRREESIECNAKINIYNSNNNTGLYVRCRTLKDYLIYDTSNIAIIKKVSYSTNNFPNRIFHNEFTCTNYPAVNPVDVPALWTIYRRPVQTLIQIAPVHVLVPLPTRIAWILAEDASNKGETCPITLEPISPISASVTTCYHVFDSNSLAIWFQTNDKCPFCKQKALSTAAFEDEMPALVEDTLDTIEADGNVDVDVVIGAL